MESEPECETVFLTEAEVARRYRATVTEGTLRNWRNKKIGPPFVKVGKGVLYPLSGLEDWERRNTVPCDLQPQSGEQPSPPAIGD